MTNCGNISKSLMLKLCKASSAGIEPKIILINFSDWKEAEKEIADNVISTLTLKEGKFGCKYESEKNSFEKDCTLAKGTYKNSFDHKVVARVFSRTQDIKDELIKLSMAKVVAIVENTDRNSEDTLYELYGADNGLEMSEFSSPSTDADGVLYMFTLASGDNAKEGSLPLSVNAGSTEATEAIIKSLYQEGA